MSKIMEMSNDLRNVLSAKNTATIIANRLGTNKFQILEESCKRISEMPGYMGEYFRISVTVNVLDDDPEDIRELKYFAKTMVRGNSSQNRINVAMFSKEVFVYTQIFPEFERLTWCPTCYFAKTNEVVVADDLAHLGFEMGNKFDYFTLEQCEMVLQKLAEFHAQSIIYEERLGADGKKRNLLEIYGNRLNESFFRFGENEDGYKYSMASIKAHVNAIEFLDLSEDERERLRRITPTVMLTFFEFVKPSRKFRNVLCHGDLWANNVLFKRENGVIVDSKLVDFQMARYNPPAHDVQGFLHLTTPLAFRKRYGDHLFRLYHSRLAIELTNDKLDIDDILPLNKFLESCTYYEPQAVIMHVYYYQILMADDKITDKYFRQLPEMVERLYEDKTDFVFEQLRTNPIYEKKLRDVMMAYKEMCDVHFNHMP